MARKNVLLIIGEKPALDSVSNGVIDELKALGTEFDVKSAWDYSGAIQLIETVTIHLVVVDLSLPEMGGFDFLIYLNRNFSSIPAIVVSEKATPETEVKLEDIGAVQLISKPLNITELAYLMLDTLSFFAENRTKAGVSLGSMIHLIEMEAVTCVLEVHGKGLKKGYLYLYQGELYDADCGTNIGGEAALELISREDAQFGFISLPIKRIRRRIEPEFLTLVLNALKLKEETRRGPGEVQKAPEKPKSKTRVAENFRQMGLSGLMRNMGGEIENLIAITIVNEQGKRLATYSPKPVNIDAFSAKIAMVMRLVKSSIKDIHGVGEFEENLVQTKNAWNLTRTLFDRYYLVVTVNRVTNLGYVRLTINKYLEQLRLLLV